MRITLFILFFMSCVSGLALASPCQDDAEILCLRSNQQWGPSSYGGFCKGEDGVCRTDKNQRPDDASPANPLRLKYAEFCDSQVGMVPAIGDIPAHRDASFDYIRVACRAYGGYKGQITCYKKYSDRLEAIPCTDFLLNAWSNSGLKYFNGKADPVLAEWYEIYTP